MENLPGLENHFSFGWIAVWITEILLFVARSWRAGPGKAIM
jgi:hypothetical protein